MPRIARRIFGLSPEDATLEKRGFPCEATPALKDRIETIGTTFMLGFNASLEAPPGEAGMARLCEALHRVETERRGFAFEGAAMAFALLDVMTAPWSARLRRFETFLAGEGGDFTYMAHVGAGWAMARLPFGRRAMLRQLDPRVRWLALDGWGFHQGYFHHETSVYGPQRIPRAALGISRSGYARSGFDQGLGRSLWFVEAANVERIPEVIDAFPLERRPELWSGVGLASTYAGGVSREALLHLLSRAGAYRPELAQGAAFAAEARVLGGNPTADTELACRTYWGLSAGEAAELTRELERDLPFEGESIDAPRPAYETWRRKLQRHWMEHCAESVLDAGAAGARRASA